MAGGSLQQARWIDTRGSRAPAASGLGSKRRRRLPGQYISTNSKPLASRIAAIASNDGSSTPSATQSIGRRSEEHTSELQSRENLVCRLLLEKKKKAQRIVSINQK